MKSVWDTCFRYGRLLSRVLKDKKFHSITKIVVWDDLNPKQSHILKNAPTLNNVKEILVDIFKLNNYSTDLREQILLNLYIYAVQFAREENYITIQLSAYFSIVKHVHEICVKTPYGNLDETFQYFKDLLISHSVCRPPNCAELFSIKEVRKISYHVINTYFRHFKLYKYAFTPQMQLDLVLHYIGDSKSSDFHKQKLHMDSEKEMNEKSRIELSQITVESSEEEMNLVKISEKEEAKKYLKNLITEFLQEKIIELKLLVKEKLKQSEHVLNVKLKDAGYHERRSIPKPKVYQKSLPNMGKNNLTNY